ncbi:serine hydrolase-like protein [Ostrinia nubilalis]|uniref:serine hydrolase-like protein n=1 Tax=Ostrinia nubilalis TaxID=29057 RepID=UPI0030825602
MSGKEVKEWFVDTVFGKLAVVSWGDPSRPPVLMVHGYMDTAATFIPLMEELPDSYYYVAFDVPGHGKSCHLPMGPSPTQTITIESVRAVVNYMAWDSFLFMGHSIGGMAGVLYNRLYPGKITRIVLLDPLLALAVYYNVTHDIQEHYRRSYYNYYDQVITNKNPRSLYPYDKAVSVIMKNRQLTRKQAEIVLSRSLEPLTGGLYRFTTQPIMKKLGCLPLRLNMLIDVLSKQPPILSLVASKQRFQTHEKEFIEQLSHVLKRERNFYHTIEGHHDVHVTNPELLAPFIADFLKKDPLVNKKAKL